jgi:hypothetical protein
MRDVAKHVLTFGWLGACRLAAMRAHGVLGIKSRIQLWDAEAPGGGAPLSEVLPHWKQVANAPSACLSADRPRPTRGMPLIASSVAGNRERGADQHTSSGERSRMCTRLSRHACIRRRLRLRPEVLGGEI